MGMNGESWRRTFIYFDIETIGNPAAVAQLGPCRAAGNLKDPAKIAASIAEKEQARIERAALDCDTLSIVALGYVVSGEETPTVLVGDEVQMLETFWEVLEHHRQQIGETTLVGFNCIGFDLPAMIRRSQIVGVRVPPLALAKYRHDGIVDVMSLLTWDGLVDPKSLTVYCRLFGLDVPDDDSTGADVARLYAEGKLEEIASHCRADVAKTRALHEVVVRGMAGAR